MRMRDPSEVARAMDRSRLQLERFCKGLQISTKSLAAADGRKTQVKKFKIRALSRVPASAFMFENDQGQEISIQTYFQQTYNYTLRFPGLPCVQVTKKAWYPMEVCTVERGNKYTKKLLPDQVAEALKCKSFGIHEVNLELTLFLLILPQSLLNLHRGDSNSSEKVSGTLVWLAPKYCEIGSSA